AMVVFGPVIPCQMAHWLAALFMSANGIIAGFTKYGFRLVSESRVNSYWVWELPDVVPSTTPIDPVMPISASSSAVTPTANALDRSIDAVPFEPSRSSTSNSLAPVHPISADSSAVTPAGHALDRSIDAVPCEPSRSSPSNSGARYASAAGPSSDGAVGLVGVNGTSPAPHTDIAAHAVTTPST